MTASRLWMLVFIGFCLFVGWQIWKHEVRPYRGVQPYRGVHAWIPRRPRGDRLFPTKGPPWRG